MTAEHEPPAGHARATGGLLAALAGEMWPCDARPAPPTPVAESPAEAAPDALPEFAPGGTVTTALLDLAHAYVEQRGGGVPIEVAARQDGVPGPAWLLAVAIARPHAHARAGDALQLAKAAGVPGHALSHCVVYVELAAELLAGRPAGEAVTAVTGEPAPRRSTIPVLCGEPHLDALAAGTWVLCQPGAVDDLVPALAAMTPPEVCAAAAGLLGLRDGVEALPAEWRALPEAPACTELAGELVRVRHEAYLRAAPRSRAEMARRAGPPLPAGGPHTGARRDQRR